MASLLRSRAVAALLRQIRPESRWKDGARNVHDGFAGLNVYKDAAQAPVEKDDSEYPDWLWTLQEPRQTRQELMRKAQGLFDAGGYDAVFDGMSEAELKRLFRLDARARIKEENNRRRGGRIV